MAKTDYRTIDEYHAAFGGDSLSGMQQIRSIIHEVVPEAEEAISYQIPCFKYKGYMIYYCAFPKHITISSPWTEAFLSHFADSLKGYKVSKSAIQFPNDKPIPVDFIREIVAFRAAENRAK